MQHVKEATCASYTSRVVTRPRRIIPEILFEIYLIQFCGNFPEFYLIEAESQWSKQALWRKLSPEIVTSQQFWEFLEFDQVKFLIF